PKAAATSRLSCAINRAGSRRYFLQPVFVMQACGSQILVVHIPVDLSHDLQQAIRLWFPRIPNPHLG
ncbi:MAG TPA: hypothetical protein VF431_05740, partial [Candidatus Methylomirabilis sp.]